LGKIPRTFPFVTSVIRQRRVPNEREAYRHRSRESHDDTVLGMVFSGKESGHFRIGTM